MKYLDGLLSAIFQAQPHPLESDVSAWLASSRRFSSFVDAHQSKIRKKLRQAQTPETAGDLRLELETAYLLLRDKNLSLEYEPEHRARGRSPDFAVRYTTSMTFRSVSAGAVCGNGWDGYTFWTA
jgi:hypothetical protein